MRHLSPSSGSEWSANKLSRWLFSRVLAAHAVGPGSNPGRDMSVSGPLDQNRDDPGHGPLYYCYPRASGKMIHAKKI